ncbi:hypothetical protein [Cytobacillus kochii]
MKKSLKPYKDMYEVLKTNKDHILNENPPMEFTINAIMQQSKEGMKDRKKLERL